MSCKVHGARDGGSSEGCAGGGISVLRGHEVAETAKNLAGASIVTRWNSKVKDCRAEDGYSYQKVPLAA